MPPQPQLSCPLSWGVSAPSSAAPPTAVAFLGSVFEALTVQAQERNHLQSYNPLFCPVFRASSRSLTYLTERTSHRHTRTETNWFFWLCWCQEGYIAMINNLSDKSFHCCLCYTGDSKILLFQVWALTGEEFTLRTWAKTHSRRSWSSFYASPKKSLGSLDWSIRQIRYFKLFFSVLSYIVSPLIHNLCHMSYLVSIRWVGKLDLELFLQDAGN